MNQDGEQKSFVEILNDSTRFFDVTQIVLNKNENMRNKLVTVFNAVGNVGASLLFQINGTKEAVTIRLGIKNHDGNPDNTGTAITILKKSIESNFPGTLLSDPLTQEELQNNILDVFKRGKTVAAVTDIAGLRSEEESREKQFIQGIEKLIDALQGLEYTLFLIADPVNLADLNINRRALENIYSQLVPFSSSQYSLGENESYSINESFSLGVSKTISKSITNSVSHTTGKTFSETKGDSFTKTDVRSKTKGEGTTKSVGAAVMGVAGALVGGPIGAGIGAMIGGGLFGSKSKNFSETESHMKAQTKSNTKTKGGNESDTKSRAEQKGSASTRSISQQTGSGYQMGESQNLQIGFENHTIKRIMERIDKILNRYDQCADLGMWNCCMYCIGDKTTAEMAASIYRSIIRGKNSSLENSNITVWENNQHIMDASKNLSHPRSKYNNFTFTPGTLISSAELAIHAGLPNHSVPGIPVIECAEFGRSVSLYKNIKTENGVLSLGKVYNMHKEEELPVMLSIDSLTSHTFITGSTGSGKSHTVYKLLSELYTKGKFLIIEPAKGEYKKEFGHYVDAIYITTPKLPWPTKDEKNHLPLLRINPFSFRKGTHILEHLDRLIEIFNVCWPMYAAMPAVLKEAVEKAYEDCGWDLIESENKYDENLFPSFADVERNIRTIIDSSDYDAENKGAYKGALVTRLKSLSTGIYGQIFGEDEISEKELFENNVIVDLSRVGSAETKSLIMGLLVLKLQEYRMNDVSSSGLKHVTVLEEAHNLLKRTSTEQLSESSNLIGKSVEMLTNAIAEMRSFGEGFIIADQAPGLLDLAVIRNTNTKIILRLPNQDDRELVGKAANLNDDQITELAKLPCGVAAVYQNEWIEPVLCSVQMTEKIEPFSAGKIKGNTSQKTTFSPKEKLDIVKLLFNGTELPKDLAETLPNRILSARSRFIVADAKEKRSNYDRKDTVIGVVLAELYNDIARQLSDINSKTSNFNELLFAYSPVLEKEVEDEELRKKIFTALIVNLFINELHNSQLLEDWKKQYTVR